MNHIVGYNIIQLQTQKCSCNRHWFPSKILWICVPLQNVQKLAPARLRDSVTTAKLIQQQRSHTVKSLPVVGFILQSKREMIKKFKLIRRR